MPGAHYYNEFEPYAAEWLRNLIKAGLIPAGDVDTRSILDVRPDDLKGYTQCHFFAGIGGWPLALQRAGWDASRPVWTGSCPCQPFSTAGKQKGGADDRHLWPVWFNLIRECRPPAIFGEQVASAISHGWLDGVFVDLEREGYSCGSAVLPACAVDAPHRRDRLWFVAYSDRAKSERWMQCATGERKKDIERGEKASIGLSNANSFRGLGSVDGSMAHSESERGRQGHQNNRGELERGETMPGNRPNSELICPGCCRSMGDAEYNGRDGRQTTGGDEETIQHCTTGTNGTGQSARANTSGAISGEPLADASCRLIEQGKPRTDFGALSGGNVESLPRWRDAEWTICGDGKARRIPPAQSGVCIVAHGVPARVGKLRAFGNAIVPEEAGRFIIASEQARKEPIT